MITTETLKESARRFESELCKAAQSSPDAKELLQQMQSFIVEASSVESVSDFAFRRLGFDRPFIEGPLADNIKLANAYAKFCNQFEGLEV